MLLLARATPLSPPSACSPRTYRQRALVGTSFHVYWLPLICNGFANQVSIDHDIVVRIVDAAQRKPSAMQAEPCLAPARPPFSPPCAPPVCASAQYQRVPQVQLHPHGSEVCVCGGPTFSEKRVRRILKKESGGVPTRARVRTTAVLGEKSPRANHSSGIHLRKSAPKLRPEPVPLRPRTACMRGCCRSGPKHPRQSIATLSSLCATCAIPVVCFCPKYRA